MAQKTYSLRITKKIQECDDACTLVLTPSPQDGSIFENYKPAQFLSFHLEVDGKKLLRSYSLSSSPLLKEPLTTTIKKVEKGIASSYLLDHLKEGDTIQSSRPQGKFFKIPDSLQPHHYFMVAGGSGITPLFSIIKTVLSCDEKNQVTLVYCNRKETSIIYNKELSKWVKQTGQRFKIIHVLSQPTSDQFDFKGRLTAPVLQELLTQHLKQSMPSEYYLCGPNELMKMSEQMFLANQIDKKHIRKESFGVATKKIPKPSDSALVIQAPTHNEMASPKTIQTQLDGEMIEITAQPDISILEQLIDSGHSPPFSCMEGNCMTCMATLKKGRVYQEDPGILDEENISSKEILTCQAKPLSALVEVDYE